VAGALKSVLEAKAAGKITREACNKAASAFGWSKIGKKLIGIYHEVR
jgi:hypothetical protein